MDYVPALARWIHFMAGVMWIGLLYYFNFVQGAFMAEAAAAAKPEVTTKLLPRAMFWFRWAAMSTFIWGIILIAMLSSDVGAAYWHSERGVSIVFGGILGIIMWFNVWFIIWPNQKKNIGIVQVTPEEKAKAARTAGLTSRVNTLLSIPMLYCMASVHQFS